MNSKSYSEEKRQHSSWLVPYSYYKCLIPDFFAGVPMHWHGEFEINYILEGSAEFICSDEHFISNKGDIIIIPPNMLHSISVHGDSRQLYDTIVFSGDMLGADSSDRCAAECIRPIVTGEYGVKVHITPDHDYYGELKTSAENIFSCAKGNTPRLDMLMKSELLRFFWLLEDHGDIFPADKREQSLGELLRPAFEYIGENFHENITVEQLARTVHMSRSYFMDRFKAAAGVGAVGYVNQLRIKCACELLISTDMTSAQIAFECGFRNLSNFNRQFRRITGCTPKEYRHNNKS
ncbi:MAG: helix-turn-helix domain-containing protein [Oscillospiraceae bacterium]